MEHPVLRAVPGRVPEPSKHGEEGRDSATAALPWPLKTPDGEGVKGGGWSEKSFYLRRRSGPAIASWFSSKGEAAVAVSPQSCGGGGGGVGSQPQNKNHPWNKNCPWQKAPSQHKGLPICQIFKQSLNFAAGTYLEADLQESSGILLRLARLRSGYSQGSQEVLLLLIYTRQLSCLANTDKVIWGGKAKPARCLLGME